MSDDILYKIYTLSFTANHISFISNCITDMKYLEGKFDMNLKKHKS